jgi:hypothetical protein
MYQELKKLVWWEVENVIINQLPFSIRWDSNT